MYLVLFLYKGFRSGKDEALWVDRGSPPNLLGLPSTLRFLFFLCCTHVRTGLQG